MRTFSVHSGCHRCVTFPEFLLAGSSYPSKPSAAKARTSEELEASMRQGIAVGKWELRLADPPGTKPYAGWCTLILRAVSGTWSIEAWRYTVDPPPNTTPAPTILKKPGWPGGPGGG
jgi:hypothetical protein